MGVLCLCGRWLVHWLMWRLEQATTWIMDCRNIVEFCALCFVLLSCVYNSMCGAAQT